MFMFTRSLDDHAPHRFGAKECLRAVGIPCQRALGSRWVLAGGIVLLLLSFFAPRSVSPARAQAATVGQITEFPLSPSQDPSGEPLVLGSDGKLYFSGGPGIGRITPTGQINFFSDPAGGSIYQFTPGPDGNLWFLESTRTSGSRVGRITPAGVISEFTIPPFQGHTTTGVFITAGPDGNLWFTANAAQSSTSFLGLIGRVTLKGVISEFGTPTAESLPEDIVAGSGNTLWFTEVNVGIARITTSGQITEFPVQGGPVDSITPDVLLHGSDGNIWFATGSGGIARITSAGKITQFNDPASGLINHLVLGPDGNIWFLEESTSVARVGRITPTGRITEFTIPPFKGNSPAGNAITAGPDGNLWFTANTFSGRQLSNGLIGRVTTAGVISEFGTPTALSDPEAIASGSDGNVWFIETNVPAIGRASTH